MGWLDPPPLVDKPRAPEVRFVKNRRYYAALTAGMATWIMLVQIPWLLLLTIRYGFLRWRGMTAVFWPDGALWVEIALLVGAAFFGYRANRLLMLKMSEGGWRGGANHDRMSS